MRFNIVILIVYELHQVTKLSDHIIILKLNKSVSLKYTKRYMI